MKRRSTPQGGSRSPTPARSRGSRTPSKPPPATPTSGVPLRIPDDLWPWIGAFAVLALLWSCRGYRLGVPVADDYSFLARLDFQKRLDPFDTMGATYYWRPLSRQGYFSLVGHALFTAPWVAALLNIAALLVTYVALWRIARRAFSPGIATAIAVLPLLSEPARTLIAWPSGAQHLFAGALAMLALDRALAGRWVLAALLAGIGMLCHESAALALIAIPIVALVRSLPLRFKPLELAGVPRGGTNPEPPSPPSARRDVVIATVSAAAVLGLWLAGYAVARAHGVGLPPRPAGAFPITRFPTLMSLAIPAALNLEDLPVALRQPLAIVYALTAALALLSLIRPGARRQLPMLAACLGAGVIWFLIGVAPLTQVLPDWNSWRAWLPSLGLNVGLGFALGLLLPPLAAALAGLKLVALLLAPPAAPFVTTSAPVTASQMAYVRLARLQRTLESTRLEVHAMYPTLPHGGTVRYWNLPRLAEVAFQGSNALRVWYGDSTLTWQRFGGLSGLGKHFDGMVEYRDNLAEPATAIEPESFLKYTEGGALMGEGKLIAADTLFAQALRATRTRGPLYGSLSLNRGWIALSRLDLDAAELFRQDAQRYGTNDADYWSMAARLALLKNDKPAAAMALRRCFAIDPKNPAALETAEALKQAIKQGGLVVAPASGTAPP